MAKKQVKDEIPSLFPYQVKNRENFYFRNHPENINPDSMQFQNYWSEQLERIIEGVWVDDNGTWVYMYPKLYFYTNYARIVDEDRNIIYPRLRDIEWIMFTYYLCVEGFSGFEDDEEFTCHHLIEKLEKGYELDYVQKKKIPKSAKKKDGSYKKYVDPWYYLTRHYLIDHPAEKPLGLPLYENGYYNGAILSCRSIGKSFSLFVGDFAHEFLTSGVKRMSEIGNMNKRLLFGMGGADGRQLNRSINNLTAFYYNMPGQYQSENPDEPKYMGPFYKKVQGSWGTGNEIVHLVKQTSGAPDIQGSSLQMVALTTDRSTVGAGDRFRRIYIEEFGFLENAIDVFAANRDSMKVGNKRVGSLYCLGTGGDIKAIRQPKMLFENPEAYDIFGIPNYWKNENKKIGLFIPKYYQNEDYKDDQGNTIIELAYEQCLKERKENREVMDSVSFESDIMFNPLTPDEMLRPSNSGFLPKQEAAAQLSNMEAYDLFRKKAQIGTIEYDYNELRGVYWKKDMANKLTPIVDWGIDDNKVDKNGAMIIYEQPPEYIPENLYWVLYDPAKQSGDGASFHSVIVYKYFYRGPEDTMYDTIVAEWIGRKERLDDNYDMVIRMAKYFNARIFPETNVAGFLEWCSKNGYFQMLEPDAYLLEKEISPNHKRSYYKVGYQMTKRNKAWCLRKLRDWLTETKRVDPLTGVPVLKTMDWIFSPRVLNEIIHFSDEPKENFDHISSLLGLMLLIGKLERYNTEAVDLEEKDYIDSKLIPTIFTGQEEEERPRRARFLRY